MMTNRKGVTLDTDKGVNYDRVATHYLTVYRFNM